MEIMGSTLFRSTFHDAHHSRGIYSLVLTPTSNICFFFATHLFSKISSVDDIFMEIN